ncbi:unnamed protein product [Auanema sp. JU1783]|nr:unnamed protein product [Auanema sp. JU1783]
MANVYFLVSIYAILTFITNFPSGFTNSTVNTAISQLRSFINDSYIHRGINLSAAQMLFVQSAVMNCWFVAQVFGSLYTPWVMDRLGRRKGYMIAVLMTLIATAVQYFSILYKYPEMLIVGRTIAALSSPIADTSLMLYMQETSPIHLRGMASFFCEIGYGAMCALGGVLGMRNVLGYDFALLILIAAIPEALSLVFLFFIPETPKYLLITKGDRRSAERSLEFFQGKQEDNELILDEYEKEKELDNVNKKRSSFKEVFTTWHLREAIYITTAVSVLSLAFFPILQSSTFFFFECGISRNHAELSTTILLVVFTIACVAGASFVDKFPRRLLIIVFGTISTVFLLCFAISSMCTEMADWVKFFAVGCIIAFCISHGLVMGPITWFIAPEMVSQRHKATVFAASFAISNILISITDFIIIPLFKHIGGLSFILVFVIPSTFSLIYLYLYLPETRGRQTHQIIASMMRKNKKVATNTDGTGYKVFDVSSTVGEPVKV